MSGRILEGAFWALFLTCAVARGIRLGPRPPDYVQPGKLPVVGFWNVFDESRWTAAAIDYHKRVLRFAGEALGLFLLGRLLLALTSMVLR